MRRSTIREVPCRGERVAFAAGGAIAAVLGGCAGAPRPATVAPQTSFPIAFLPGTAGPRVAVFVDARGETQRRETSGARESGEWDVSIFGRDGAMIRVLTLTRGPGGETRLVRLHDPVRRVDLGFAEPIALYPDARVGGGIEHAAAKARQNDEKGPSASDNADVSVDAAFAEAAPDAVSSDPGSEVRTLSTRLVVELGFPVLERSSVLHLDRDGNVTRDEERVRVRVGILIISNEVHDWRRAGGAADANPR